MSLYGRGRGGELTIGRLAVLYLVLPVFCGVYFASTSFLYL